LYWHSAVWKLFDINDISCTNDINNFTGCLRVASEIDEESKIEKSREICCAKKTRAYEETTR